MLTCQSGYTVASVAQYNTCITIPVFSADLKRVFPVTQQSHRFFPSNRNYKATLKPFAQWKTKDECTQKTFLLLLSRPTCSTEGVHESLAHPGGPQTLLGYLIALGFTGFTRIWSAAAFTYHAMVHYVWQKLEACRAFSPLRDFGSDCSQISRG